jgi:hypothetical protein
MAVSGHALATLYSRERTPGTHCTAGWVSCSGHRLQEKSFASAGHQTPVVQFVVKTLLTELPWLLGKHRICTEAYHITVLDCLETLSNGHLEYMFNTMYEWHSDHDNVTIIYWVMLSLQIGMGWRQMYLTLISRICNVEVEKTMLPNYDKCQCRNCHSMNIATESGELPGWKRWYSV